MWRQCVVALLGLWLMLAPAVLGYGTPLSTSDRIAGPLMASAALVAAWEATRAVRWVNVVLAVWVFASPVVLGRAEGALHHLLVALAAGILSAARAPSRHSFGGGWASLFSAWRRDPSRP
jgi:ABC-type molybdate transport system permease subunit